MRLICFNPRSYQFCISFSMLEVPHQNGFHPASCSSPLPSSHTPSPGLSNGSPGSNPAEVKKSDFRPANLKVVIPNSGPPQSLQQSGSLESGGLLGISRGHDDVSISNKTEKSFSLIGHT